MDLKELTTHILQQEFEGYFVNVRFSGPYEDKDLDAEVILRDKPVDLIERSIRVRRRLWAEGVDVPMLYEVEGEEDEYELER
jgi:tRNA A-37 threonylcarbamoyl transferase component Bud32